MDAVASDLLNQYTGSQLMGSSQWPRPGNQSGTFSGSDVGCGSVVAVVVVGGGGASVDSDVGASVGANVGGGVGNSVGGMGAKVDGSMGTSVEGASVGNGVCGGIGWSVAVAGGRCVSGGGAVRGGRGGSSGSTVTGVDESDNHPEKLTSRYMIMTAMDQHTTRFFRISSSGG